MSERIDTSEFSEHLTLEECNRLLHFGHSVPVLRGYTSEYVAEHFPGWTWNTLVSVFKAARIAVSSPGSPLRCDERVAMFHFSDKRNYHVEWNDEAVDQAMPGSS